MPRKTISTYCVVSTAQLCLLVLLAGCAAHQRQVRAEPGRIEFQNYCAACHQYDGQGMGDAPPLARSPWVNGSASRLIRIVLHGVRGPMVLDGKSYDQEMPGFGQILSDTQMQPCCPMCGGSLAALPTRSRGRLWGAYALRTNLGHNTGA